MVRLEDLHGDAVAEAVWLQHRGFYRKLRLTADAVAARLEAAGFALERQQAPGGMVAFVRVLADRSRS